MTSLESLYASIVSEITASVEQRIMERLQTVKAPEKVMGAKEAAEYLGISTKTIYTLCSEKQIRHIPVGAKGSRKPTLLFRQSTLDDWLRQREEESIVTKERM